MTARVGILRGNGEFGFSIVEESRYQDALEGIDAGASCGAALVPETTGPGNAETVRVEIEGKTVGYLSGDMTPAFLRSLSTKGFSAAVAKAKIVGTRKTDASPGRLAVILDISLPFVLRAVAPANQTIIPNDDRTANDVASPRTNKGPENDSNPSNGRSEAERAAPIALKSERKKRGRSWLILLLVIFAGWYWLSSGPSEQARRIADIISSQFGGVCIAKIEGSDTLRIDWTGATRKIDSIAVIAAVGKSKETIYAAGIRYFKFPNNAGSYNIIDWKTGEKTYTPERAQYYFRD